MDLLKARLNRSSPSRYDRIETSDLRLLVKTRMEDLSRCYWRGLSGKNALSFLLRCLEPSFAGPKLNQTGFYNPTESLEEIASRHPSLMKRLRRPAFKVKIMSPGLYSHTIFGHILEVLQNEKDTLLAALRDMKALSALLRSKIGTHEKIVESNQDQSSLWTMPYSELLCINLDIQENQSLLSSTRLLRDWSYFNGDTLDNDPVEKRIEEIRGSLPPLIPLLPSSSSAIPQASPTVPQTSALQVPSLSPQDLLCQPIQAAMATTASEFEPLLASSELHLAVPSLGKASRSARRKSSVMSIRNWFKKRPSIFDVSGDEFEHEVDQVSSSVLFA